MAHDLKLPKILITGTDGQVGFELTRTLAPLGKVVALVRADLDLSDALATKTLLDKHQPDIIVNPAAYTAVDKAESEVDLAYAVNAQAADVMARWADSHGAMMVHYSTDYVFDGTKLDAYVESDLIAPQSVYGASKAQGEKLVRDACAEHFIFRTSWVFGAYGANFLKTMLNLMKTRDALNVVNDQLGAPTSSFLLADVTAHIVRDAWQKKQAGVVPDYGTYHLTASGVTSWYGYAQYVASLAEQAGVVLKVGSAQIKGIPTSEYPTPAKRPANSRLNINVLQNTFGLRLPDWQDGVRHAFNLINQ
jgi:dTDP-4-dehydrorhamnose reductase